MRHMVLRCRVEDEVPEKLDLSILILPGTVCHSHMYVYICYEIAEEAERKLHSRLGNVTQEPFTSKDTATDSRRHHGRLECWCVQVCCRGAGDELSPSECCSKNLKIQMFSAFCLG